MNHTFDKEKVYDDQIFQLMNQIIQICRKNEIPMLATFNYKRDENGEDFFATTAIGDNRPDEMKEALQIIRNGASTRPKVFAMTVTKT